VIFISPNQATLIGAFGGAALGAVIGGAVSFVVARYTVRHAADYSGQIDTINSALGSLAATQEEMRAQYAGALKAEEKRYLQSVHEAEAARWKPEARIESRLDGTALLNELLLKSPQDFFIKSISLAAPNGAKLEDFPVSKGIASTGHRFAIPQPSLNKVAEISPLYFSQEKFDGAIVYVVEREKDGALYEGSVTFHGGCQYVNNGRYYKLSG
jgi:hypothetical protein